MRIPTFGIDPEFGISGAQYTETPGPHVADVRLLALDEGPELVI